MGLATRTTIGVLLSMLAVGLGANAVVGCGGGDDTVSLDPAESEALTCGLLEETWQIQSMDPEVRAPYEAGRGWITLVMERDVRGATEQLGAKGGLAAVRGHVEAATMYRQAALLSANALVETYGVTPHETDPIGTAHLLTVSYAIRGEMDKAREQSALLDGEKTPEQTALLGGADSLVGAWHQPWKDWLDSGGAWPPDLSALPTAFSEPTAGGYPTIPSPPHYRLREQVEEDRWLEVSDPGALVAIALWHDAVARAATDTPSVVPLYTARYRLPVEASVESTEELPFEMLFGSDYLVDSDAAFLAAVTGEQGAEAVGAFKETSLLACLSSNAQVEGKIDAEKAIDQAAELRKTMLATMKERAGGNTEGFHRTFSDLASVAVLRGLALVAEAEGARETSGRLRLTALERSTDPATSDPSAELSMAAWDASNRYPLRGTEILHNLIRRFPDLETARFSLEVLALRVSRERGPQTPGQ